MFNILPPTLNPIPSHLLNLIHNQSFSLLTLILKIYIIFIATVYMRILLHLTLSKSAKLSKFAKLSDAAGAGFKKGSKASWVLLDLENKSEKALLLLLFSRSAALKGSAEVGTGGAGAALVGPGLEATLPPTLGGAGRGGGALLFFGGRAGVGLSDLGGAAVDPKGSAPKGSESKPC